MPQDVTPHEATYGDYRDVVVIHAESTIEEMENYPETYDDLHEAVWESVDGSRWVNNYGYMLATVLLSDQNPDSPEYCEAWTTYADLSDDNPNWSEAVGAMAYVCLYSDVYAEIKRSQEESDDGEE